MLARRILRLAILLVGGVALVWVFGVDHGESLLSGAKKRNPNAQDEVVKASSSTDSTPPKPAIEEPAQAEDTQMALRDAHIPVREALKDRPDVKVLKYVIAIGRSETGVSRRILADDVSVEIYNKKIDPESKRLALVRGARAEIEFRDVPDPKSFRDAVLLGMTLSQEVVVEYLDEAGKTIAKLECAQLHLGDKEIKGPGPCRITMEGLTITGTDLTLDRETGTLRLERDVLFKGSNFALPSRTPVAEAKPAKVEPTEPPVERTIACAGPYTFVPSKAESEETTPQQAGDDLSAAIRGGVMMFRERVVATEGDTSRLTCDDLEVVLKSKDDGEAKPSAPKPEAGDPNALRISRFFARGSSTQPAMLKNPQGTFVAETLLLEDKDSGQWITLQGQPKVLDAAFGGATEGEADAKPTSRFNASAQRQLRIRPADIATQAASEGTPTDDRKFTIVELDGSATLERKSENPDESFRLDAERIEMNVSSSRPEGAEKAVTKLEELTATGAASGTLAQGTFHGDVIKLLPKPGPAGADPQFEIDISPNPNVDLTMANGEVTRQIKVRTPKDGRLKFTPSIDEATPAVANFTGATTIEIYENGAVDSTLNAKDFIKIQFQSQSAGGAIENMHAKGDVKFDSPSQGFSGRANELTMTPQEGTKGTFDLIGSPAVATVTQADQGTRTIRGMKIRIDPDKGTLHAEDSVSADLGDLAIANAKGSAPKATVKKKAGNAVLHCQKLDVVKDEATGATIVLAEGSVVIDDTENGLHAVGRSLRFEETVGKIFLFGTREAPAQLTRRVASKAPDADPTSVEITGPELALDSKTTNLFCERDGSIRLVQPAKVGKGRSTVNAACVGPIRYGDDRLDLNEEVIFRFEEDGEEVRSLWSDRATVWFVPEAERDATPTKDGPAGPGIKEMYAEGRVHLVQTEPRPLEAEGQSLRWKIIDGVTTMFLEGSSPKCWVKGLSENKNLRYEADSFSMRDGSQEFTADNGRFVYEPEVAPR